ncbi:hypothetical protein RR48_08921 [Papilio machaon]|uniref:Uncharacterized protein n=1 Tax=Papilio machaon TaxID=76193 RepID=A0A194QWY4_PAPMA|nr:hypothetical protein RR48_08921 [Papilio machaon]
MLTIKDVELKINGFNEAAKKKNKGISALPYNFASARSYDEGVEEVNWFEDVIVDSVTTMAQASLPPDLNVSADGSGDDDDTRLTLAYENLYEVPRTIVERFSDHIKYLDISHNKIT